MPNRTPSTKKSATKKSATKKSTLKNSSTKKMVPVNNKPKVSIFQQSLSYTSNPLPGNPYGKIVTVAINNGKKMESVALLNKNGRKVVPGQAFK